MSFGLTDDREAVGYYAGFVLSAFMLGRLVSSYPLGVLSDSLGRRPVIELGLWSCVVFQLGFGLAPTFELALLMRFLMGMCNGIIGVSKAWLPGPGPNCDPNPNPNTNPDPESNPESNPDPNANPNQGVAS